MSEKKNVLKDKSFSFAIRIINLYKYLSTSKNEYVLSKQLLRSGTAVGALIRESQNTESKADFIHKLAVAQKECDESIYWIELLYHTEYLPSTEFESINNEAIEILKIIRSIIITSKNK
ncbi:four helix bundle protein [Chryseobacterium rhizoplanae]|uniref:Four helix bundle protein n=1 Tax=Chryseobacterium rhizoplanae TaxID=1609531 RepID=A0A521BI39_9FLAO|nr:four helix bundle protein [Chryseobacterium rhizoplanae]SMO46726.1 four helix bundle protein [Chryseobacterium rhizoplanae]